MVAQRRTAKRSKKHSKNVSIKDVVTKVVKTMKQPFQRNKPAKKAEQHKKPAKKLEDTQIDLQPEEDNVDQPAEKTLNDKAFAESTSMSNVSKFFYTNDSFFDTLDDQQLYNAVIDKYPDLAESQTSESLKKKALVCLLENDKMMHSILSKYNMNICDFMRFLFRMCPSMFKGIFIKKIQKLLESKKYAKSVKFSNYKHKAKRASAKKCSIF